MHKELKEEILGLPPLREVDIDIDDLVTLPEGEPQLFEDTFPHVEVPRFRFTGTVTETIDGKPVTFDFSERANAPLCITDTTFRDGQQARPPYTRQQIVDLYRLLGRLSGPNQVISATEFFVYADNDLAALRDCLEVYKDNPSYPEPTCWIRGLSDDALFLKLMQHWGVRETGILTSCSDYHVFLKLKKNWKSAATEYLSMAKQAAERDVRVRFHLEDVTRANMDEFVSPFLEMIARFSDSVPDELKPKVRLCDTMGFGLPYPAVDLPRSIPKLIHRVQQAGIPSNRIEWHGHNDFHHVIPNAVAAWLYGCDALNGTLLGFGERTGNPPVEAAIIMYQSIKGTDGTDSRVIPEIADYFRSIGVTVPPNYPLVGEDSNRTRAGIHGGGLAQDERIYQIFDTSKILGIPPAITITDKSGLEGIGYWVQCFASPETGGRADIHVRKTRLVEMAKWVDYQYDELNRTTGISDDEMTEQALLHMPDVAVPAAINKWYALKDGAAVSAEDCAPVITWIKDEKKRLKEEMRENGNDSVPLDGITQDKLQDLIREYVPHLRPQ